MNIWMRKTFGTSPANPKHHSYTQAQAGTNGKNLPGLLNGLKGIYSLVSSNPAWASGHADILKPDGTCDKGCHFDGPIDYIDVWELQ
jgi:hypothetical protein